jgi:hypothetical protein
VAVTLLLRSTNNSCNCENVSHWALAWTMRWKRQDLMNFDEASSVCTIGGIEIETACLAGKTPGLTEKGLSFLADQRPIPFTRQMHPSEKLAFKAFCNVVVFIRSLLNPGCGCFAYRGCD